MSIYLFEKEIRVFGMKRSGNGAIRNFIRLSFPVGVVSIINNSDLSFRKHGPFPRKQRERCRGVARVLCNNIEHMPIVDIGVCLKPRYSYDWERWRWARYYGKRGIAEEVYNLIIIRSPHNHLASVLKFPKDKMKYIFTGGYYKGVGICYLGFIELWIQYAEEVLGITNHVPDKKVVVLFDKFVSDSNYRESISDVLGIPYVSSAISSEADNELMHVSGGPASSFDWNDYAGQAQEMKVLDRWKYLIDPGEKVWWTLDECKEKLLHPKVVAYTKAIFDIDLEELF